MLLIAVYAALLVVYTLMIAWIIRTVANLFGYDLESYRKVLDIISMASITVLYYIFPIVYKWRLGI